jgi:hypothetical protein
MEVLQVIQELVINLPNLLSPEQDQVINLKRVLTMRLEEAGFSQLKSTELAEKWTERLEEEFDNHLQEWDYLGIPRPIVETSRPGTFFTLRHPKYKSVIDSYGLKEEFPEILEFLSSLNLQDFLLVPICLLRLSGCDPIFVTKNSDVDCIGQVSSGPTRSHCIFIKAKPNSEILSRDTVMLDYAKFQQLQKTAKFTEYLAALGKLNSVDGRACCYIVAANSEFDREARDYASVESFLLRSRRQIAFWLSQNFGIENLVRLKNDLDPNLNRELALNLAPLVDQYLRINNEE